LPFAHENSRERRSARLPDESSQGDLTTPREGQFWRRVRCNDQITGDPKRPSTAVFADGTDELGDPDPVSVYIAIECRFPSVALDGYEGFGLIMLTEALVRECQLRVVEKNQPGPPGHVVLVGPKTYSVKKRLAKGAKWVVPCP
jgi:hypothetical protein